LWHGRGQKRWCQRWWLKVQIGFIVDLSMVSKTMWAIVDAYSQLLFHTAGLAARRFPLHRPVHVDIVSASPDISPALFLNKLCRLCCR
jgi:hypothetical protein